MSNRESEAWPYQAVFPELVEGHFFFLTHAQGKGFDKLSQVGFGGIRLKLS